MVQFGVMVEYSETLEEEKVKLSRSVTPNENTMAAGADIQLVIEFFLQIEFLQVVNCLGSI